MTLLDSPAPTVITTTPGLDFPVVGIGASAGGLAAFTAFFKGFPADRGLGMGVRVKTNGHFTQVDLIVSPVREPWEAPGATTSDGNKFLVILR